MTDWECLFDLSGKNAWVVGGGGYLGGAACEALAAHGARVAVADARIEAAQAVASRITAAGGEATAHALDITAEEAVARQADAIAERGRLDIAVNCTAGSRGRPVDGMTLEDWQFGLGITLGGAFVLAREAGRVMRAGGGGSIVQFGSMYGLVSPDPGAYPDGIPVNPADYGAAKAGVLQLVRYLAVQWAQDSVRVNAVVPGPFPNPAGQGGMAEFTGRLERKVPLGRLGRAEEIAGAVVYLASDAASYVTGTQVVVDGGWTAW
jgi:NAD(P)-dependent dehydrogenase (short-subunit alcohol dehydrogenase family)